MMRYRTRNKRKIILFVSLILLATISIGGTLAYVFTSTESVVNTFVPASVSVEVDETIENGFKKDVKVNNTGNATAYIRAAVIINWLDNEGNIYPGTPDDAAYTISWNLDDSDWAKGCDGYYYYTTPVAVNGSTAILINSCQMTNSSGYTLVVEIIAESIQAAPTNVVCTTWNSGVSGVNGTTLTIKNGG